MEYLERVLGIKVYYKEKAEIPLPAYIYDKYDVREVSMNGANAIFLYPVADPDPVNIVRKHIERIQKTIHVPVVLILQKIMHRQREYLLQEHIPFIAEGKQIYLPFMAVYLQERCDGIEQKKEELLPSSQLLLLYFIYHGSGELPMSIAAENLGFTPMSISRAAKQLENTGIIRSKREGTKKILFSNLTPEELFDSAKDFLYNPVKRTIYVPQNSIPKELLLSGYSALSEYSMLNPPSVSCYASQSSVQWQHLSTPDLIDSDDQCSVEIWRYDPGKLSNGLCVDPLSLAISLQNDLDERVESAVEEMLSEVWRKING